MILTGPTACEQRPVDVAPETTFGKWVRFYVTGSNTEYYELSGSSPSNLYLLRDDDILVHYDGTAWSEMEGPDTWHLNKLWVAPDRDVFVTRSAKLYRYDGSVWSTAFDAGGSISDVWGSSSSDIYLTRYDDVVFHFDGSTWEADSLKTGTGFHAIWGSGSSDVYIVGSNDLIFHNDGAGWAEAYRGAGKSYFFDVWGSGSNDVYAAERSALVHYDGSEWSDVNLPVKDLNITAVRGTGRDDVFLIYNDNEILHFDGTSWSTMNSNTSMPLNSMWCSASDDVWAVGGFEKIIHFDGNEWSSVSGGQPRISTYLWGLDENNVYVGHTSAIFHYDGAGFEEMPNAAGGLQSTGLWGTSPSQLISAGRNGKIFHYDGARWNRAETQTSEHLWAVSGAAGDAVWVVGGDRTCFYYNGDAWTKVYEDVGGGAFRSVWAASRSKVFAVGNAGLLTAFNGVVWTFYDGVTSEDLLDVWGSSSTDVFAISQKKVFHFDGSTWERMPLPSQKNISLNTIGGSGPLEVFAGDAEVFYYFNGSVWSVTKSQKYFNLIDIWCSRNGSCFGMESSSSETGLYRYRK